ncbi:phenylalanyl-tRNA synthetase subunit beta [Clavulina sp. PMI_390]|nr:phenylalanyl-tRNA synthetase subunit beta [Clavulina sp. PMI_390]
MPTVSVDKADLFERLGRTYTTHEFDELCFEFGLELDEDTTEEVEENIKKGLPAERPQLKIEIAANRYDMLCIEGISRAMLAFLEKQKAPTYKLIAPPDGKLLTISVTPDTARIRPLFAGAILRNISFTPRSYASFIDLQDKLHQNICRRRQLVAIGTHDLDTLLPPFRYEARAPKDIKFAPLNKQQEYDASELMTLYESDRQLSKYLHIIRDSPVYPIIYDQKDRVLSMPPIINSEHSKITLNTKNVFIDVTATDQTKLDIVVNMVSTMFSEYCGDKFSIEPVRIELPDGSSKITPDISTRKVTARPSYINACTGLSLKGPEIATLLNRMSLSAETTPNLDELVVEIPPTRPDIFHECDVMEDAAIAYGFNNLPKTFPKTSTVAQPLAVSKLSDMLRAECAYAGWVEVLPLILCSHDENFAWLNRKDDGTTAVRLANPKTTEYQVVRTTLLPGLLKTIRENRAHTLPIKIFETSDVVFKDPSSERQASNTRRLAAVWCNKTAGFEVVHGLLDRVMAMLEIPRLLAGDNKATYGYYIKETDDPTFFPGRAATVYYRPLPGTIPPKNHSILARAGAALASILPSGTTTASQDVAIGTLGILHPTVLSNFEIQHPCSALELELDWFKKEIVAVWEDEPTPDVPGGKMTA